MYSRFFALAKELQRADSRARAAHAATNRSCPFQPWHLAEPARCAPGRVASTLPLTIPLFTLQIAAHQR